ncbi:MAG: dolichyl-phosphate-mannose--protein mannosyltransferase [Candidatus Nanopelagicales bacterium]
MSASTQQAPAAQPGVDSPSAAAAALFPPFPSTGWRGWIGPLVVMVIGGILRFTNLGRPDAFAFDEVYYAKDGLALLRYGYEQQFDDSANDMILASDGNWRTLDVFKSDPSFVVHPPFGKWVIASGEWLFGVTPFGWRFAVAVLGTLSILMVARIARRLTRSDLVGVVAGILLAVDGMHLVTSRTAVLDMVLSFTVLAAFGCLLLDRDQVRRRFAGRVPLAPSEWGPALGPRPWRWAAGIALGLACAVKWSGLWYVAAFGLLTVLWDVGLRRRLDVARPWSATFARSVLPAFVAIVGSALVVYLVSWTGWLITDGGWGRQWADSDASWIPAGLRSLWHYHAEAWHFHVGLDADHSYQSNPMSWFMQTRPTSFYWHSDDNFTGACGASTCVSEVLALGNPVIWWFGSVALLYQAWRWVARRDWRSGALLIAVLAGWVPWLLYLDRTIFTFYSVIFVPYIAISLAMAVAAILGPAEASPERRRWGAAGAGAIVLLAVALGWWFYPVWTGAELPYAEWQLRMWMPTWV